MEAADRALEIDAENLLALNMRSTALNKLDRSEESFDTIAGALREDPNNAFTHANYGWGLLERGDHKKALGHFKEALRANPNMAYAQSGLLEAVKATNPAYKLFLKYSFWMGNMSSRYQWGVIIGFYFGFRLLRSLAQSNEALRPFLIPIIILMVILAFSTWIIAPISNLFLRFNKYGKLLLDEKEKMSSNLVAVSLLLMLTGLAVYLITADERFVPIAVFGFAMIVPLGVMFSPTKYKNVLLIYTIAMAIVGIASIAITFSTNNIFTILSPVFIVGFIAFQWGANFLIIREDNS